MTEKRKSRLTRREFIRKSVKTAALAAAVGSSGMLAAGCSTGRPRRGEGQAFDLIIKNGTVYNGEGGAPGVMDIGVRDGKIAALSPSLPGGAAEIINAEGLIVTPGFIDVHTHCDLTFKRAGWKRSLAGFMPSWKGNYNYLYQGVSTVVSGNCGYGFTDIEKWYGTLDSLGFGTNVHHLAPHGMIRLELFGTPQPTELTAAQMDAFKGRIGEEMDKGAVGLSAGLEYSPGLLTPTSELIELCRLVRAKGGIFTVHMRDESGALPGRVGEVKAIEEALEIARRAEIPVEISHLKISRPFGGLTPAQVMDMIEAARDEGLNVTADQYPYDAGSTELSYLLPDEFRTSNGIKEQYKTRDGRAEMAEAMSRVFEYLPPELTMISMNPENEDLEGKNLKQAGEILGKPPEQAFADLVAQDDTPVAVFFFQDVDVVRAFMPRDYIITASDGWTIPKDMTTPHPRVYGTFPRKLKRFVLDEKIMPLESAIRSMTALPADKFGIKGRGRIVEGCIADLAVIDLAKIGDHATYQNPHQYSTGVVHLLVNGSAAIKDGEATGTRAGQSLRKS